MIAVTLFAGFALLMIIGVPIGVCLGLAGAFAIWLADQSIMAIDWSVFSNGKREESNQILPTNRSG